MMGPFALYLKEGVLPLDEAFMKAGIVILVVFFVLLIMYILISISGAILHGLTSGKSQAKPAAATVTAAPAAPVVEDKGEEFSSGTLKLKGCDEKTAAMIMAIVSDNTGIPLSELVFKSITLVEEK